MTTGTAGCLCALLADIRAAFGEQDAITTAALLDRLNGLDDSPWGESASGKASTPVGSERLRPFGIKPRRVGEWTPSKSLQGYQWEQFEDVVAPHT